jgi:hypothetical protein
MKIVKGIFYLILTLIALLFIVAIFLPSQYRVERSVEVNQPVGIVYGYVADFNNFHQWSPWTILDPNHPYEVTGDSGKVGQKYFWDGDLIGSGYMVFTEFKPYDLIISDIVFLAPQEGEGVVDWKFNSNDNKTKVTWGLTGNADYPLGRYYGLMMDNFLGKSFEEGMSNLKKEVEKNISSDSIPNG